MTDQATPGYVTDAHPAARERDTHDPAYDAWLTGEAGRLAEAREDLRRRYPDDQDDDGPSAVELEAAAWDSQGVDGYEL